MAAARKVRKKGKGPRGRPFSSETWTPEFRARYALQAAAYKEKLKTDPWAVKPWGVPKGMSKKEAIPLWRAAHKLADKYLDYMKKTDQAPSTMDVKVVDDRPNVIPHTQLVIPDSDEEKAVMVLREAFVLAMGPVALPDKLKAMSMVLTYTKPKPESTTKLQVTRAEDFLDLIADVTAIEE